MKTPMVSSATSFQRLQTSLQSPMPRLPRSNVYSTQDPANPSASVHRKRFFTPSLTLKFLCAGYLNRGLFKTSLAADNCGMVVGDFEGEVERGQILARMVLRIGELRDAEIVRPRLGSFVDAGIKVDEMPAGLAGSLHDQFHIALAVEGAGIADIIVVIDHVIDVGGLGPAYALEVNPECGVGRTAAHVHRQRCRLDPVGTGFFLAVAEVHP